MKVLSDTFPNVTQTVPSATFEKPISLKIIECRAKGLRPKRNNRAVYVLGAINSVESVSTEAPKFDDLSSCKTPLSKPAQITFILNSTVLA